MGSGSGDAADPNSLIALNLSFLICNMEHNQLHPGIVMKVKQDKVHM